MSASGRLGAGAEGEESGAARAGLGRPLIGGARHMAKAGWALRSAIQCFAGWAEARYVAPSGSSSLRRSE